MVLLQQSKELENSKSNNLFMIGILYKMKDHLYTNLEPIEFLNEDAFKFKYDSIIKHIYNQS